MSADGLPIVHNIRRPVGDSVEITFEFQDVPVVGTGITGFALTGEVRLTAADTGTALLDLSTGGRLSMSGQTVSLYLSEADTKLLGAGTFHFAIKGRKTTSSVTLVTGQLNLSWTADHT